MDTNEVRDFVTTMYSWHKLTGRLAPGVEIVFGGADVRAVDFLAKMDSFYLSKFVRNPEAKAALTDFLQERYLAGGEGLFGRGDPATLREMKDLLSQKMVDISEGQAQRIVDTAVQRTRSWAHASELRDIGAVEVEVYEPTQDCPFCQAMHGRVIRVDLAWAGIERQMAMSEEEFEAFLKSRRPVVDNIEQYVTEGLLPPYHPFCHGRPIVRTR